MSLDSNPPVAEAANKKRTPMSNARKWIVYGLVAALVIVLSAILMHDMNPSYIESKQAEPRVHSVAGKFVATDEWTLVGEAWHKAAPASDCPSGELSCPMKTKSWEHNPSLRADDVAKMIVDAGYTLDEECKVQYEPNSNPEILDTMSCKPRYPEHPDVEIRVSVTSNRGADAMVESYAMLLMVMRETPTP